MTDHSHTDGLDLKRRAFLQTAGAAVVGGLAASTVRVTPAAAQVEQQANPGGSDNAPLGARLQGVQHFGSRTAGGSSTPSVRGGARASVTAIRA